VSNCLLENIHNVYVVEQLCGKFFVQKSLLVNLQEIDLTMFYESFRCLSSLPSIPIIMLSQLVLETLPSLAIALFPRG
jgi:hypothetical protein